MQIIFNIFRQRPAELFFEQARKKKVGILARVPLASGLLTGKLSARSKFEKSDHRAYNRKGEAFDRGETFAGVPYEDGLRATEELRRLVQNGMTMTQFALRWILMFEAVSCAIPGAKNPAQAEENARAADLGALSRGTMRAVRAIYSKRIKQSVHEYW